MEKTTYSNHGREEELRALLKKRILLLDGAMGTALQDRNLTAEDFGGISLEGCNENLVLTRPDVIEAIHEDYLKAGADILETNSFGGMCHVLGEYQISDKVYAINKLAAELAKKAADKLSTPDRPRFVAGSMGPGTKTITVTGGITFDKVCEYARDQALALMDGGADLLLLETQQDTLNIKASINGIHEAFAKLDRSVPIMLSVSIETMGTMLGGQNIEALYASIMHYDLLAVGLNCATGPDFMIDHLRTLSEISRFPVVCYPNAGLPDENGAYNETPEMVAKKIERFATEGWVNIVGGCCGTTGEHISLMEKSIAGKPPRKPHEPRRSLTSGYEPFVIEEDKRPVLVGERTNVIGSRLFKKLIVDGKYEEGSEIGRRQVRNGAQILDVCLANPDQDELKDMKEFLGFLSKKVKVPIMIDSTDEAVIEASLKICQGKCIINSVNLEDGEERLDKVIPLIRKYGGALVVGTIDEDKKQGMGVTRERKLAIAKRSYDILTKKYGLHPEDLYFDPLVFPTGTGDKNYFGSAIETIEAIRAIKKELPRCKTILGVSNVSFGLPTAGREVLNAVYLNHCVKAGLDLAIVNSEKLARFSTISDEEKKLCDDLLFWKGPGDPSKPEKYDAVAEFAAHFRDAKPRVKTADERMKLPINKRLPKNVLEGSKEGLTKDLDQLLSEGMSPLKIINGPLMAGMDEVGKLFAANEMIVAEVLQSAEVMKAAVSHLEPHMDSADMISKGKIILATVKGDVHDIGKNLVHIILKNNGFEVTDLGIKVLPETLIAAIKKVVPHALGLSGLLVKSAQQMVLTADDLTNAGIQIPILVGGAALSPKFTATRIAPRYDGPVLYAKDAMSGLSLMNKLQEPADRETLLAKNKETQELLSVDAVKPKGQTPPPRKDPAVFEHDAIVTPPDLKLHVISDFRVEDLFDYINPIMLYGKHLGLKNPVQSLKEGKPKAVELYKHIRALQDEILAKDYIKPRAVFRFFAANGDGDSLHLFESPKDKDPIESLFFPRQEAGDRLCLADFVAPRKSGKTDFVAMFAVTCGEGIRELSEKYREEGNYLKSHAIQAIAIETAEGFAELLHEKIRAMWGIKDPEGLSLRERFQARYRGLRVSFGYPACPNLDDQKKLFRLIEPTKNAGIVLTEGMMMEPEASVTALVFHHPKARYFSAVQSMIAVD